MNANPERQAQNVESYDEACSKVDSCRVKKFSQSINNQIKAKSINFRSCRIFEQILE